MKNNFLKSVCYLFTKYILFFFLLAFLGDRFRNAVINNSETYTELIKLSLGYVLFVLMHILILVLLFSIPIYYILKIKNNIYFILSIIVFFIIEYFIYTYLFSPSDKILGIYNLLIGVVVFFLFLKKKQFRR